MLTLGCSENVGVLFSAHYAFLGGSIMWQIVGSNPGRVKLKTIKLVYAAYPLSTQQQAERTKTGWLGIRIMCPCEATCLPADCCFSELAL